MSMPALLGAIAAAAALTAPPDTRDWEARALLAPAATSQVSVAEASLAVEPGAGPDGAAALRLRIEVDHFHGEKTYPVGWPRVVRALTAPADRDWSAWEFLRLRLCAETPRPALPNPPMTLSIRSKGSAHSFGAPLRVEKGRWTDLLIPTAAAPDPAEVSTLTLSMSEAHYQHGDRVDVLIADVSLIRPRRPTLLEFATEASAVWADTRRLPVRFWLLGVPAGEAAVARFEVRDGDETIGAAEFVGGRGAHRAWIEIAAPRPAVWSVRAWLDGADAPPPARVIAIAPPWP